MFKINSDMGKCLVSKSETVAKLATVVAFQVFDNYAVTVMIGGEPYTLGLFDTAGKKLKKLLA